MSRGIFPETRVSAVMLLRHEDESVRSRALEKILSAYYRPVYKHIRLKWRKTPEEAEDLAQEFFATAVERDVFGSFDPSKARLRTYVRVCLDRVVENADRDQRRKKRGGGVAALPLDIEALEAELAGGAATDVDAVFDMEWKRSLFAAGVDALRGELQRSGKTKHFRAFERYDLHAGDGERPTYAELAEELGLTVSEVTNYLHVVRKMLRRAVLECLREVTTSDEELEEEARRLGLSA